MAVTLTGTSSGDQGLFNRLGKIGNLLTLLNAYRGGGSAGNLPVEIAAAAALYDGDDATQRLPVSDLLTGLATGQAGLGTLATQLRTAAQRTLVEMFDADSPLPSRTVAEALIALGRQMRTATTHYVDGNSLGATVTSTGNDGNGAIVVSTKNGEGYSLENLLAETILITCVEASTAGQEVLRFRGEQAVSDRLSHLWPAGSGCDARLTAIAAGGTNNLLTNGDFEDFTVANTPDGWTLEVGAAGTEIFSEGSVVYAGAKALKLAGGTAVNTQIYQALTGLRAKTPYAVNLWCKNDVNPAAGVLTVDLHDGSNVIADDAGTNNSFTIDLTTLGTSYVAKNAMFRLPEPVPSTVRLRVRASTAISSGTNTYLDHLAFARATQLNASLPGANPFVCPFSGASNWSLDDGNFGARVFKLVTTNDLASLWQLLLCRLFETDGSGWIAPVSGTTLVNDSLIG